jgi:uncharacterized protein (DUF1684 family)
LLFMALIVNVAAPAAGTIDDAEHRRDVQAWQAGRDTRLRADGGWLTLAGLFWLKPGPNRCGAAPENQIVLPADSSPAHAGVFVVDAGAVWFESAPGAIVTLAGKPITRANLKSDSGGATPDVLALGSLTMQAIERHGRLAVRLKDRNSKTRQQFKGLHYFPIQARYRVVARFVPHDKPVSVTVPDVLGVPESMPSPGTVKFELDGRSFRLDPVIEQPGDTQLFFIFRDLTAGKTTYGAGRFLYADAPKNIHKNAQIVLDFNKAYTPPCGFTPYATCPLPPAQNRLSIAIEAGELFSPNH